MPPRPRLDRCPPGGTVAFPVVRQKASTQKTTVIPQVSYGLPPPLKSGIHFRFSERRLTAARYSRLSGNPILVSRVRYAETPGSAAEVETVARLASQITASISGTPHRGRELHLVLPLLPFGCAQRAPSEGCRYRGAASGRASAPSSPSTTPCTRRAAGTD